MVVEVCHSWMNRFRKLLIRYEKKSQDLPDQSGAYSRLIERG
jgi:hypothetical protein